MPEVTAHQLTILRSLDRHPAFWVARRGGGWQQKGGRHRFRKQTIEDLHQLGLVQRIVIKGAGAVVPTAAGRQLLKDGAPVRVAREVAADLAAA